MEVGENVTPQDAALLVGFRRVHVVELKVLAAEPVAEKVIEPVGAVGLELVSVTVAVQVASSLRTIDESQVTLVVVP